MTRSVKVETKPPRVLYYLDARGKHNMIYVGVNNSLINLCYCHTMFIN